MSYSEDLNRLNRLKDLYKKIEENKASPEENEEAKILYGELEDLITELIGNDPITFPTHGEGRDAVMAAYPNLIAAGLLGSRSFFQHDGYNKLLAVIGRVQRFAKDPLLPKIQPSITNLTRILRCFREACQYQTDSLEKEEDVKKIIWIMLRPQFELLKKEENLPKFGAKSYKPDFGEPTLHTLIEVKYIGQPTEVGKIQDEILADVPGYLSSQTDYTSLVVFVYDAANKLKNPTNFITDLKSVTGIIDVIVIPGF